MLHVLGTPVWFARGCENAAGKLSRGGKQQQGPISPNHVRALYGRPVQAMAIGVNRVVESDFASLLQKLHSRRSLAPFPLLHHKSTDGIESGPWVWFLSLLLPV